MNYTEKKEYVLKWVYTHRLHCKDDLGVTRTERYTHCESMERRKNELIRWFGGRITILS